MAKFLSKPQEQITGITVEEALQEAPKEAKPVTLLDQALDAARPKRLQRDGEVVIILDVEDLSKTFRLRSEDVDRASPLFKHELHINAPVNASTHGAKHLFILQKTVDDGTMLLLGRKPLDTLRADCEDEFYRKPSLETVAERNDKERRVNPAEQIKVEHAVELEAAVFTKEYVHPMAGTWIDAYESFIRIIAFPSINSGVSKIDVDKALEKIEPVAQIAKVTGAIRSISCAVDSVLTAFIQNQQLWSAIAKDAALWLLVGVNLEKSLIYDEAFTHIAGCYPDWPWSTPKFRMPLVVLHMIAGKSLSLELARKDAGRKLLCLTLTDEVESTSKSKTKPLPHKSYVSHQMHPVKFGVVGVFRDWVALHLAHIDSGEKGIPRTMTVICDRRDKECLTVAGLHRPISKGGDVYMPWDIKQTLNGMGDDEDNDEL